MDFTIESRDGFLWVAASGRISLFEAQDIFKEVCEQAFGRGLNLVLVDCSAAEGELSTLDQHELGRKLAEYAIAKHLLLKLAIVGHPAVCDGFTAIVASNRGVTAEAFQELNKAISWLNRFSHAAAR